MAKSVKIGITGLPGAGKTEALLKVIEMLEVDGHIVGGMITTPIYVPVMRALGFDIVWYGILFTMNLEMAYLTPPFGGNLFYLKGVVPKSVSMMDIYRSAIPFLGLSLSI